MSQCAACSEGSQAGWQGQAQVLAPCLLPAASSPSGFVLLQKRLCPSPGKSLTRESSFPVAMAIADSKQPVVEKVQQLPQTPYIRNRRGTALECAAGSPASPKHWGRGAQQECRASTPSWAWPSAQPLPRAHDTEHRVASGEFPCGTGTQHCSSATAHSHQPLSGHVTHSSSGFSQVSRNFPSFSSRWSRDMAQSCAGSSPWWLSSSASEAGGLWCAARPVAQDSPPPWGGGIGDQPTHWPLQQGAPGQPRRAPPACTPGCSGS